MGPTSSTAPPSRQPAPEQSRQARVCHPSPLELSEFWKWPPARQTDSQFWTHSRSTGCLGREVNAESTDRTCPRLPGNKRHHIPLALEKPVCQWPLSRVLLPVHVCWAHFTWARQMAPLSVRFLPRAALLLSGSGVECLLF